MAFFIAPHPLNPSKAATYADNRDITAYATGDAKIMQSSYGPYMASQKLPTEAEGTFIVPLKDGRKTKLVVSRGRVSPSGWRGKSSAHRCYAQCPDCEVFVPAGRAHQHKCKG